MAQGVAISHSRSSADVASACSSGGSADRIEILQRAVDQSRSALGTGDRRHEGIGTGGQDQPVVRLQATGRDERPPGAIDVQHFDAQMQLHAVVGVPGGIA